MNKKIFKSIGAVVAGFGVVLVLSIATDFLFESISIFPGTTHPELYAPWMLAIALLYRSIYTIIGGYITARLAPQNPMHHIYMTMIIGLVAGTLGAIGGWNLGNHWYPVLLAVTGPVFVWLGGKLHKTK